MHQRKGITVRATESWCVTPGDCERVGGVGHVCARKGELEGGEPPPLPSWSGGQRRGQELS